MNVARVRALVSAKAQAGGVLPKLTISMRAEKKAELAAISTATQQPVWRVVDDALNSTFEQLAHEDRPAIDTIPERMRERVIEAGSSLESDHTSKRRSKL